MGREFLEAGKPELPAELQLLWENNDDLRASYERLAAKNYQEFVRDMPEPEMYDGDNFQTKFVRRGPRDAPHKVMVGAPFCNFYPPQFAMSIDALADSFPEDERPEFFVVPNNLLARKATKFAGDEQRQMAGGDFTPLASRFHALAESETGPDTVWHYFGRSQGGAVGAAFLRLAAERGELALGPSGIMEPPNGVRRKFFEQVGDLIHEEPDLESYKKIIRESGLPALNQAQHVGEGKLHDLRMLAGLARFAADAFLQPESRAMIRGFSKGNLHDDIYRALAADETLNIALFGGSRSKTFPVQASAGLHDLSDAQVQQHEDRLHECRLQGYTHNLCEVIPAFQAMGVIALQGDYDAFMPAAEPQPAVLPVEPPKPMPVPKLQQHAA